MKRIALRVLAAVALALALAPCAAWAAEADGLTATGLVWNYYYNSEEQLTPSSGSIAWINPSNHEAYTGLIVKLYKNGSSNVVSTSIVPATGKGQGTGVSSNLGMSETLAAYGAGSYTFSVQPFTGDASNPDLSKITLVGKAALSEAFRYTADGAKLDLPKNFTVNPTTKSASWDVPEKVAALEGYMIVAWYGDGDVFPGNNGAGWIFDAYAGYADLSSFFSSDEGTKLWITVQAFTNDISAASNSAQSDPYGPFELSGSSTTTTYRGFTDVKATDWFVKDGTLDYALDNGLMQGYGNGLFGPYNNVKRGDVAMVLWRLAGTPNAEAEAFSDVDYTKYYGAAIIWCRQTGVISGYGKTNTFGPENLVTREELCVMLANYAEKVAGLDVSTAFSKLDSMPDADSVHSWARKAMGWAMDQGVVTGSVVGGVSYVQPTGNAQRCVTAAMVSRFHRNVL